MAGTSFRLTNVLLQARVLLCHIVRGVSEACIVEAAAIHGMVPASPGQELLKALKQAGVQHAPVSMVLLQHASSLSIKHG